MRVGRRFPMCPQVPLSDSRFSALVGVGEPQELTCEFSRSGGSRLW